MSGRDPLSAVPVAKARRTGADRRHKLQDALEAAESRISELTSSLAVAHSQLEEANTAALNLSKRLASKDEENLKLQTLLSLSGQVAGTTRRQQPVPRSSPPSPSPPRPPSPPRIPGARGVTGRLEFPPRETQLARHAEESAGRGQRPGQGPSSRAHPPPRNPFNSHGGLNSEEARRIVCIVRGSGNDGDSSPSVSPYRSHPRGGP